MSTLEEHDAEQAAITAQCEAGTCDHPECNALEWTVIVTRDVTASRAITVRAASEDAASEKALRIATDGGAHGFTLDDGITGGDIYVSDVEEVWEPDITVSNAPPPDMLAAIKATVLEMMRSCVENGHYSTLNQLTDYEVVCQMVEESGVENVTPHIDEAEHPCVLAARNAVAEFRAAVVT